MIQTNVRRRSSETLSWAFERWARDVADHARTRLAISRHMLRASFRVLSDVLDRWYKRMNNERTMKKKGSKAMARRLYKMATWCFDAWHMNVSRKARRLRTVNRISQRSRHKGIARVWSAWIVCIEETQVERDREKKRQQMMQTTFGAEAVRPCHGHLKDGLTMRQTMLGLV